MEATQTNLLTFMRGPKQYLIPIYQRTYSWSTSHCQQLWNDIVRVATDENIPAHFLGSIVYINEGIYQVSAVPRLLVIDGQQRLTTLSLLLAALANALKSSPDGGVTHNQIRNYYLLNNDESGELRQKLILTRGDRDTLIGIIDGEQSLPIDPADHLIENYRFFERRIAEGKLALDEIYRGINKLIIVDVSLDRNYDNPQLIFESLNSTGLDLSQSDLIRNYILMGLEPKTQERLYNRYWYPIESRFGEEYAKQFDFFMRDYLTLKNGGKIPTLRDVYDTFKDFSTQSQIGIEELVADVFKHAMIYVRFVFPRYEEDTQIKALLADIKALKMEVAYPFLLEVFLDYESGFLSREELIEILRLVESYVFRRAIVGIPTNSMNKTFANLSRSIKKDRYLESVKVAFRMLDSYRRFPDDEEFMFEFVLKDVYNFRNRSYLLRKLENHNRKEPVNIEEWTIEHIMPQNENLSNEWREMLGENWQEVQSRYLHTIGNLTLTGYNPELSDRPFYVKRDMEGGFRDSPIRLNKGLRELELWNEQSIEARAWDLADLAKQIWIFASVSSETIKAYRSSDDDEPAEYGLDHYEYLEGHSRVLFDALRKHIFNLDPGVREEPKKLYIAYKTTTNFVDIVPQRSRLRLSLNMHFDEIHDPRGMCRDVTSLGRWGNGDVEIGFESLDQLDYIMYLIKQSFDLHDDDL